VSDITLRPGNVNDFEESGSRSSARPCARSTALSVEITSSPGGADLPGSVVGMPSVFISHAAADKALVDEIKTMIQEAVGLNPTEIFYSSSAGSGIPAGRDFVAHIREEMRDAGFVVAVITPAYLESKFCLAELGAVWYADDKRFFPLGIAVDYDELEATLLGIQVPRLADRAVLTGLLQGICEYADKEHVASASTEAADKFLATLPSRVRKLQAPTRVPAEKVTEVEQTRDRLAEELSDTRDQLAEARDLFEKAKQATSLAEIEELEPPGELREQVEYALDEARTAVNRLDSIVAKALPYDLRGEGMPWPDAGEYESARVSKAVDEGYLRDGDDGVYLNDDWPRVADARDKVRAAQDVLRSLNGEDEEWFVSKYNAPPDLRQGAAFKELL
jgi:hypothetical protein